MQEWLFRTLTRDAQQPFFKGGCQAICCVITLLGWIVRLPWDCKHYNWMLTVLAATTPDGTPVLLCGRIGIRS